MYTLFLMYMCLSPPLELELLVCHAGHSLLPLGPHEALLLHPAHRLQLSPGDFLLLDPFGLEEGSLALFELLVQRVTLVSDDLLLEFAALVELDGVGDLVVTVVQDVALGLREFLRGEGLLEDGLLVLLQVIHEAVGLLGGIGVVGARVLLEPGVDHFSLNRQRSTFFSSNTLTCLLTLILALLSTGASLSLGSCVY